MRDAAQSQVLFESAGGPWEPTRAAALARLEAFAPKTGRFYAGQRNYDRGPAERGNVSALSPWIRTRMILEEEVIAKTLARNRFADAEKFVQEVFWRGYFKGWLEHRPDVWRRYEAAVAERVDQLGADRALSRRYENAVSGRTGIDCFDAWAAELVETGYLHNHARMWFASIWIFTLKLPWQLGADFFHRHLLDGDPASNTCSWRWVGGLHTQGKTYLARPDNIRRYTDGRFAVESPLAGDAPPLSEPPSPSAVAPDMGDPALGDGPVGLLVTEEDCNPETLPLDAAPVAALFLTAPTPRSPLPTGAVAAAFAPAALGDACARYETRGVPCVQSDAADWGRAVVEWARAHRIETIATARPAIGPVAQRLETVRRALACEGLSLACAPRPYDAEVWPHARKGFFGLKKKIPQILGDLGLA